MDPAARTIVKLICLAFSVMQWGCAHVISPELRAAAKKDLDLPKVMADPERYLGEVVIWGGMILEAEPEEDGSTLVVLESPLDVEGTPRDPEFTRGRFLARSKAFLDPAVYCRGRKVTIAGVFFRYGTEVHRPALLSPSCPVGKGTSPLERNCGSLATAVSLVLG